MKRLLGPKPKVNRGLERLLKDLKEPAPLPALELADAAESYIKFFESCAESPRLNAARHRLQGLIKEVRG